MKKRNLIAGIVAVLIVVVAGVVFALTSALRTAPIPIGAPSSELAFISDRDGTWDIFTLDAGGNLRNLTDDGSDFHDYFASWSFNSDMINFITNRAGELGPGQVAPDGSDLRSLDVATGILAVLREGRFDWDPAWSPDNTLLLWSSLRDSNLEIYVAPSGDLDNRTRLTSDNFLGPRDWFGAWSPKGTSVIFGSDREGNENIYSIDVDGANLQQLTDHPADDFHPMWDLEGERLLFISERDVSLATGEIGLYWMNPDGSDQRRMAEGETFKGDPMYSADGTQVAYMSNEDGNWHIYVMNTDGTNVVRVTDGEANFMFPVWRPVSVENDVQTDNEG